MERDGFCRRVTSKLNYFLSRDKKGQEKKSCVRLPRIPDWNRRKRYYDDAAWVTNSAFCLKRVMQGRSVVTSKFKIFSFFFPLTVGILIDEW